MIVDVIPGIRGQFEDLLEQLTKRKKVRSRSA